MSSTLNILTYLMFTVGEGTITSSILQMRKLRHRGIEELLMARQKVRARARIQCQAPEPVSSVRT